MTEEKHPTVYILASKPYGTLYTGVTSELCTRVVKHKDGEIEGFTKCYDVKSLVWFERHGTMAGAIEREKRIKEWKRDWKIQLIETSNPRWADLFQDTCGPYMALRK